MSRRCPIVVSAALAAMLLAAVPASARHRHHPRPGKADPQVGLSPIGIGQGAHAAVAGPRCGAYVGFATNNHPVQAVGTEDSSSSSTVSNGMRHDYTLCTGTLPAGSTLPAKTVQREYDFCYAFDPTTSSGYHQGSGGATTVNPDGTWSGTCLANYPLPR